MTILLRILDFLVLLDQSFNLKTVVLLHFIDFNNVVVHKLLFFFLKSGSFLLIYILQVLNLSIVVF